jgi:hypothetical protein
MLGLKSTRLLAMMRQRALGAKSLHTTSRLGARHELRRAPKVSKMVQPPGIIQIKKKHDPEDSLPPIVLLEAASRSGVLDISPEKAIEILRRYQELARGSTAVWERKLCKGKQELSTSL